MNKTELVSVVSEKTEFSKKESAQIVDALFFFIVVGGIVDSGEVVKLAEVVAYRGVDDAAAELVVEVNAQAVVDDVLLFGVAECFAFVVGVVVEEVG